MAFNRFLKILSDQLAARPQSAAEPPATTPSPAVQPAVHRGPALPHPEEPMNPHATLATVNAAAVLDQWLSQWGVPTQYWDHWRQTIDIQVYDVYPPGLGMTQETPAGVWEADGKRHMAIKPQWLNPGVIAHEQAHNSYAYLNAEQKATFSALFSSLKNTNPLMKHLFSINTYGLTNDVEGHAEVYRYIGQEMPSELKQFYPALF